MMQTVMYMGPKFRHLGMRRHISATKHPLTRGRMLAVVLSHPLLSDVEQISIFTAHAVVMTIGSCKL